MLFIHSDSSSSSPPTDNDALTLLTQLDRSEVLLHPLTCAIVNRKWAFVQSVLFINFVLHAMLTIFLTILTLAGIPKSELVIRAFKWPMGNECDGFKVSLMTNSSLSNSSSFTSATCESWSNKLDQIISNLTMSENISATNGTVCIDALKSALASSSSSFLSYSYVSADCLVIIRWLSLALAIFFLYIEIAQMFVRRLGYIHITNLFDNLMLLCVILFVLDLRGGGCRMDFSMQSEDDYLFQ